MRHLFLYAQKRIFWPGGPDWIQGHTFLEGNRLRCSCPSLKLIPLFDVHAIVAWWYHHHPTREQARTSQTKPGRAKTRQSRPKQDKSRQRNQANIYTASIDQQPNINRNPIVCASISNEIYDTSVEYQSNNVRISNEYLPMQYQSLIETKSTAVNHRSNMNWTSIVHP